MTLARITKRLTTMVALLFAVSGWLAPSFPGEGGIPPYVEGEIIVRFYEHTPETARVNVRATFAQATEVLHGSLERWILPRGVSVPAAIERVSALPQIRYAEPNFIVFQTQQPDDPNFGLLWGMLNINAPQAWDIATDASQVLVAVIDTGIDYNHPDLKHNIWRNPQRVPCNAGDPPCLICPVFRGCDYVNGDDDAMDDRGHGTHVAGTIGARGNNGIGVTGVAWRVQLVPIKFLDAGGFGTTADACKAIDFAIRIGADVANNSWVCGTASLALAEVIEEAADAGMLFVAAAGNAGVNTDVVGFYPADYASRNVISVAAIDMGNKLASFSNYGISTVDLGAPGVNIFSTWPGNRYAYLSGTSMATPHVVGTAALVRARQPFMDVRSLKALLLDNVTPEEALQGVTVTGGRLNAFIADTSYEPQLEDLSFAPTGVGRSSQLTLAVTNPVGAPPLRILKITTDTSVFSTSPPPAGALMPGETHLVTVTFSPVGNGLFEDTLLVSTDNPEWNSLSSHLSGVGGAVGAVDVQPSSLTVDSENGHAVLATLTLWNGHATSAVDFDFDVIYHDEPNFISGPTPGTLPPSSGAEVGLLFDSHAVSPGLHKATIVITFGPPFEESLSVPVTFLGRKPSPL